MLHLPRAPPQGAALAIERAGCGTYESKRQTNSTRTARIPGYQAEASPVKTVVGPFEVP